MSEPRCYVDKNYRLNPMYCGQTLFQERLPRTQLFEIHPHLNHSQQLSLIKYCEVMPNSKSKDMRPKVLHLSLLDMFCCPHCHENLKMSKNGLYCSHCRTIFPKTEDGIILFKKRLIESQHSSQKRTVTRLERVTKIFTNLIDEYDHWFIGEKGRTLFSLELEALKSLIPSSSKSELTLEVGVGTGRFAAALGINMGIDPSLSALRKARLRGIHVVQGIGENLPFKNDLFDLVLVVVTICFFRDPMKAMREIYRVLKANGHVIVGFIPLDSPWGEFYQHKKEQGHPFYQDAILYTTNQVKEMLETTGFVLERAASTLLDPPTSSHMQAKIIEDFTENAGFVALKAKKRT